MFNFRKNKKDPSKKKDDGPSSCPSDSPPPASPTTSRPPAESRPPAPPPIPSALLDKYWRIMEWSKKKNIKDLRNLKISAPDVKHIRILVHGPVGAGKSSFINSIDSIFQDRITSVAIAEAATDRSFTKTFQTHYIKDQTYGSSLPFVFCDIMGLEAGRGEGVDPQDLVNILKGHIKDGYPFNPTSPCPENHPNYNRSPSLNDRIHCLVSVIPAIAISRMDDSVIDKMKEIRAKAGEQRIPQIVVLSKVDETCPKVAEDIKLVYKSRKIRDKMQECSNRLGVPMNCIFPVKCYHEEIQLNAEVDVLLLSALTFILNFANDHVAAMAPPAANMSGSNKPYYVNTDDK